MVVAALNRAVDSLDVLASVLFVIHFSYLTFRVMEVWAALVPTLILFAGRDFIIHYRGIVCLYLFCPTFICQQTCLLTSLWRFSA